MVRDGYAWAFLRYSAAYADQEALAKKELIGVHRHDCVPAWDWRAAQRPIQPWGCSIEERTKALLLASLAQEAPLFALEKEGGFKKGDPRGATFATTRLAAGAQAVRDMIVQAWEESANTPIGYPMVNVRDIESGKVRATRAMFGAD